MIIVTMNILLPTIEVNMLLSTIIDLYNYKIEFSIDNETLSPRQMAILQVTIAKVLRKISKTVKIQLPKRI